MPGRFQSVFESPLVASRLSPTFSESFFFRAPFVDELTHPHLFLIAFLESSVNHPFPPVFFLIPSPFETSSSSIESVPSVLRPKFYTFVQRQTGPFDPSPNLTSKR